MENKTNEQATENANEKNTAQKQNIFRSVALSQVNSVDDLSDYIRVTTPSAWLLVLAAVIILAAIGTWGFFGSIELIDSRGNIEQIRPIELLIGEQLVQDEKEKE
jgi:hypothetical protein